MTKENLYRAIGDLDEKYIIAARKSSAPGNNIFSEKYLNDTHSVTAASGGERTIVMDVVKRKNRNIKVFAVAAIVAVSAAVAAAAFFGTKKDKKEYREKKITNYFTEDMNFKLPDDAAGYSPDTVYADKNGIYFESYLSGETSSHSYISLYNKSDGTVKEIETPGFDGEYLNGLSAGKDTVWAYSSDENNEHDLICIDTETSEITGTAHFPENEWAYDVTENDDGTFLVRRYSLDCNISDYFYSVYDRELNLISEKSVADKELISAEGCRMDGNALCSDGGWYNVYSDEDEVYSLYRYSPEGELLYSVNDITADLEGYYSGIVIALSGNPVIFSQDEKMYHFNELDSETGEVLNRFDMELEDVEYLSGWVNTARGSCPDYDFVYTGSKKIYGVNFETDENTVIAELADISDEAGGGSHIAVSDDYILVSGEYSSDYEGGNYLCKADYEGNIASKLNLDSVKIDGADGTGNIRKIISDEAGNLQILESFYNPETESEQYFVIFADSKMNLVKTVPADAEYSEQFTADSQGRIALYDWDRYEIILYDDCGKRIASKDLSERRCDVTFFNSKGRCFCTVSDYETGKSVVYSIDFDAAAFTEAGSFDFRVTDASDGTGKYDAFFTFNDGIFGYCVSDNSLEEMINWMDSDVDDVIYSSSITDENTVVVRAYATDSQWYSSKIKVLRRADDETLKKVQEKKVLTVAASSLSRQMKKQITEFNRNSESCRIHVDDYYRYSSSESTWSYNMGLSQLEQEALKGNVPDIVIFGSDFDLFRYEGFNAFADIDTLLPDDWRNGCFENITDSMKYGEKQYAVPLSYGINCLSGTSEYSGGKSSFTVSELMEMNDEINIFYKQLQSLLTRELICENICEFIEPENFTCDFENENFINLIELIKSTGISDEEYNEGISTGDCFEEWNQAPGKGMCRFVPFSFGSFSSVKYQEQYYRWEENSVYAGFPSEKSNGVVIYPVNTAAVFDSSKYKAQAAEFIQYLLSEEVQYQNSTENGNYVLYFPVNKAAFTRAYELEISPSNAGTVKMSDCYGKSINQKKPNDSIFETVKSLVESASAVSFSDSRIRTIITEQTDAFYSGTQTAEETAANIQKKVSTYLKEIK